ncbi:MAG: ribosomal RNA small subunit methyltransferase A [Gemmatimonadetes bacterium SCN 70-22]|nr:MAG: ribosomal RNA small subunit methyltransferase A [Gemmatimonadetes bacterium SCN 70-22]
MHGRRPSPLPPPRKRLGQHFLTDRRTLERIADAVDPQPGETIIEIGPGRGALTDLLVDRAERLVAIEVDTLLVPVLRARYAASPHVRIVEGDVLDLSLPALAEGAWALVGNVPYYITTPIIFQALRSPRPSRMVFLVQREVAERVAAPPGSDAYGALSANVQALARAELVARVPAGAFHPRPKVDSAILRLTPRPDPVVTPEEEAPFSRLVQGAFGQRRKQMRRVVRALYDLGGEGAEALLGACGIEATARPETLGPEAFARLLRAAGALPR